MPLPAFLLAVTPVVIFIYFSIFDIKAIHWRKTERRSLLYVYLTLHVAVIIGIVVSFFELYIKE